MSTVEMIVLANSRKHSGRCVAGIRTDGRGWLRPVGMRDDGILTPKYYTLTDGTEAAILDVIRLKPVSERAKPHHPEDWRVRSQSWELVCRPAPPAHFDLLATHIVTGPALLGNTWDRVAYADFLTRPAVSSLAVIAPQNISWCIKVKPGGYERKIRVAFTLSGARYDLALTDPRWEARLLNLPPGTHDRNAAGLTDNDTLLFTVSLSEPFGATDTAELCCYKLVAAVIVVSQPHPGRFAPPLSCLSSLSSTTAAVAISRPTPAPAVIDLSAIDLSAYDDDPFAAPPDLTVPKQAVTVAPEFLYSPAVPVLLSPAAHNPMPAPENEPEPTIEAAPAGNDETPAKPLSGFARLRQTVPRAFMRWTPDEDATLLRLHSDGLPTKTIAEQMQRHVGSITSRLAKVELPADTGANADAGAIKPSRRDGAAAPLVDNITAAPFAAPPARSGRNKTTPENDAFDEAAAYQRHGERWSEREDGRLIEMLCDGWGDEEIALELQRKVGAIHARVVKLVFSGAVTIARTITTQNNGEGNRTE